ncbi:hypothetical protein D3C85_962510 [compost metagenome]
MITLETFAQVVEDRSPGHLFRAWWVVEDITRLDIWYRRIRWTYMDDVITAEEAVMLILQLQKHGYEDLDKYPDFVAEVFTAYRAGENNERERTGTDDPPVEQVHEGTD